MTSEMPDEIYIDPKGGRMIINQNVFIGMWTNIKPVENTVSYTRADRAPAADAEGLADLEALRWLLNMSGEDNCPRMQLTTAMDKITNSKGETHRVILERLYKNTRSLLSRAEAGK
ncbi:hypothetical protein UFOVP353_34 [uncultured Caudovirales phage]|uniref:Uncharacterized protein n=1 Tax=uncultured Caudovirales phage TaxID=2100421 RepID=A0A6J5M3W4_9CAUD|nr:hypothetical protein UFOVP353_34 [uncultured Caudovirales phage]